MTKKQFTPQFVCILILTALLFTPGLGLCSKGKANMTLNGGKKGVVPFNHHLHQTVVGDCMVCHKDFSQKEGALNDAKATGKLKKKQIMNKTCLKCHRAKKKAGEKHGPVSCKACHKK